MRKGFSLVELVVVLAIIGIITATVLGSQSSFNKTLVLTNTAYDVALTLRSAQTYGLGSRVTGGAANIGYGVHFERATPGAFAFFADTYPGPSESSECHPTSDVSAPDAQAGNCVYDFSQNEQLSTYSLGNGITINDFCAYVSGDWSCAYASGGTLSSLDIVFARPSPDPFMSANGSYSSSFPVTEACLSLTSPQGGSAFVGVLASGQINAKASSCP